MVRVFTLRCRDSVVCAVAWCPSITSQHSLKMAELRIFQAVPRVLWCQRYLWCQDFWETRMVSPPMGLKMQVGYVNIGDFRPVSCYISEMVQDMRQLVWKTDRNLFALSNGSISDDLEWPLTTQKHYIFKRVWSSEWFCNILSMDTNGKCWFILKKAIQL